MKLTPRDSDSFLKQPDKQAVAVLLYGPDSGLVRERAKAITKAILGENPDPFNKSELTGEQVKSDPAILRDELGAFSLMGGRRLVNIRDAGDKISPIVASAFEGMQTTTYLIIEAGELDARSSLRLLFERENNFAALACYQDDAKDLPDLIRKTLANLGLRANNDAVNYLANNLGNDRGVTQSELNKIAIYMGDDKEVTLEIAMLLTGNNASDSIDDLCEATASGNAGEAYKLLARLLGENIQPVVIIRSLMRYFQRLDITHSHIKAGSNIESAVAMLRPPLFFKAQPIFKRIISKTSPKLTAKCLDILLVGEKDLKSSLLAPNLLISRIVEQIAGLCRG